MPRNKIDNIKDKLDNYIMDLKIRNKKIPESVIIPESMYPDEYKNLPYLLYDDQKVTVYLITGA